MKKWALCPGASFQGSWMFDLKNIVRQDEVESKLQELRKLQVTKENIKQLSDSTGLHLEI